MTVVHPHVEADDAPGLNPNEQANGRHPPVDVRVYRFTGRQAFLRVPEAWCRECDLMVRAVDRASERTDVPTHVRVFPWWTHVLGALRFGGWHPPVLVVDGHRVAQGHDVPSEERILAAIEAAASRRRSPGPATGVSE